MALSVACKHLRPGPADRSGDAAPGLEKSRDSGLEFRLQGTTLIHIFPALTESGNYGEARLWHG